MRISILAESIRRLYIDGKIESKKVIELYNDNKITEEEKKYILEAH